MTTENERENIMTADLEKVLRFGMERFTRDIRLPSGMALRAARARQRRRVTIAAAAAGTAVVTAAAVMVAVAAAPSSQPPAPQFRTTAYVVSQMARALGRQPLIMYTRSSYSPALPPADIVATGQGPAIKPRWNVAVITGGWFHGPRWTQVSVSTGFTVKGRRIYAVEDRITPSKQTLTGVIFANHTWWQQVWPKNPDAGGSGGPELSCGIVSLSGDGAQLGVFFTPAAVRKDLACRAFAIAGHQRLNGIDTIKLVQRGLAHTTDSPYAITLWVNAATYLPVRTLMTHIDGPDGRPLAVKIVTSFTWRPVTAARLRALRIAPVPAGFKRVSPQC